MPADLPSVRQRLWRVYAALKVTLQRLQRSEPMVQGSFFLQQRRCGKPNCRCAQGQLHAAWVITRSEGGHSRTYMVPAPERGRLRQWTADTAVTSAHAPCWSIATWSCCAWWMNWPRRA